MCLTTSKHMAIPKHQVHTRNTPVVHLKRNRYKLVVEIEREREIISKGKNKRGAL
jgi:hypothetical protein